MSDGRPDQPADEPDETDEARGLTETERRRLRARVFGDVLPDGTLDERGDGWSEPRPGDADPGDTDPDADPGDEWLRRQVPPHHG